MGNVLFTLFIFDSDRAEDLKVFNISKQALNNEYEILLYDKMSYGQSHI
jgi:hypothetical protein